MQEFEDACNKGYLAIRKHSRQLLQLLEMSAFSAGAGTALPCLEGDALEEVKKRLKLTCRSPDSFELLFETIQLCKACLVVYIYRAEPLQLLLQLVRTRRAQWSRVEHFVV